MATAEDRVESLTQLHPDRFADVRNEAVTHCAEHGCDAIPATFLRAREMGVLVRAMHASYVLELDAGLGYGGLHVVDAFGRTGRLDTIERDPGHAALAGASFRRFAFAERVRVHCGRVVEVVPALSGPYDLIALNGAAAACLPVFEDLIRLVRTGGAIILGKASDEMASSAFHSRLAEDDRLLPSFGPGLRHTLAVRQR